MSLNWIWSRKHHRMRWRWSRLSMKSMTFSMLILMPIRTFGSTRPSSTAFGAALLPILLAIPGGLVIAPVGRIRPLGCPGLACFVDVCSVQTGLPWLLAVFAVACTLLSKLLAENTAPRSIVMIRHRSPDSGNELYVPRMMAVQSDNQSLKLVRLQLDKALTMQIPVAPCGGPLPALSPSQSQLCR